MLDVAAQLESVSNTWYKNATVRYTPRIIVPSYSSEELIFPIERSSICDHSYVNDLGKRGRSYVLTQAAYQFLYGVGLLETKFVIQCCLDLMHNHIEGVDNVEKLQALTVIIDEGYHAHVALDYIVQMESASGIKPLLVPETNRKLDATQRAYELLPEASRADFQLLAVTLAENVLTDEIASIGKESDLTRSFIQLMKDHVRDEGRHSSYFMTLMKKRWSQLTPETQGIFCKILPEYIDDFLSIDLERKFEHEVLRSVGFSESDVETIIRETEDQFRNNQENMVEKTKIRLYKLLKKIGVNAF